MLFQFCSRFVVFSVAWVLISTHEVFAYIPPSHYIVKTMTQKRAGVKSVRIRSTVIALQDGKPAGVRLKEVATYDYASHTLRSRISDDSGRELYVIERKLHAEGPESTFGVRVDELLLASSGESLTKTLSTAGISIRSEAELQALATDQDRFTAEQTTMQRMNGTVAWVLGGGKKPPSSTAPATSQLWVEKDTFLPLRLLTPAKLDSKDGLAEATFQSFRYFHEFAFPRLIEVAHAGVPQFRVELAEVQVNPEVAEMKKAVSAGFTDAGNSAASPVRDLIRKYFELAR